MRACKPLAAAVVSGSMLRERRMQAGCQWKKFELAGFFAIQALGCAETRVKNLTSATGRAFS